MPLQTPLTPALPNPPALHLDRCYDVKYGGAIERRPKPHPLWDTFWEQVTGGGTLTPEAVVRNLVIGPISEVSRRRTCKTWARACRKAFW